MKTKQTHHRFAALLDSERWSGISIPILSVILSLITASIMLIIMGKNPLIAFLSFLQGSGFIPKTNYGGGSGMLADFFQFLSILAPMLLASLGFIVAFRSGLFNIGISGQMLASGFLATALVGYGNMSSWLAKPLVVLIGIVTGGLLGAFVGYLKYRFNVHEVVSTIMLNYIISYFTGFFINDRFADPLTRSMKICSEQARLTWDNVNIGGVYCSIPLGVFVALAVVFVVKFLFDKTVFGFELRAVGSNANCAKYVGIKVGRRIVVALMLSGMLAGLAGVTYYCGYFNTIVPKSLPSLGYDAIAVALLGNSSPIGCIFASVLITIFQNGSNYMSSTLGVAKEIASLITGILLLFSACGGYFRYLAHRRLEAEKDAELAKNSAAAPAEQPAMEAVQSSGCQPPTEGSAAGSHGGEEER